MSPSESPRGGSQTPESTEVLLSRIRAGDADARERLIGRILPALERWARGRVPSGARDLVDTDDLVQMTLLRAFKKLEEFESRGPGAFLGYLRQALMNRIRDESRRAKRRPHHGDLADVVPDEDSSPLARAIGTENLERYESALEQLPDEQRHAFMLRMELDLSHQEVADAVGCPSANAARMLVSRALLRLSEAMKDDD